MQESENETSVALAVPRKKCKVRPGYNQLVEQIKSTFQPAFYLNTKQEGPLEGASFFAIVW